ncbi:hypothetical protein [Streptomyces collinus]|uniref:hypothetical protein n=1 Tax=Streptomyces collinus TaxID=42684 RepID=UPI000419DAB3|nr:hypothetical protein [Streptomyces collinus]UJA11796.1 hypothetical protein HGI10_57770 [Streptomyces collinus]UJA13338.1 hypothetical protein HGI09_06330 [Streptomyces collinus]
MTGQVRGTLPYATAALHGAATGALPGVLASGLPLAPYGPRGGRPRSGPALS